MGKKIIVIISIFLFFCYCQGSYSPPFDREGEIYSFFKNMSDSLDLEVLDPDSPVELISTNTFSVYNGDIMPDLYQQFSDFLKGRKPDSLGKGDRKGDYGSRGQC